MNNNLNEYVSEPKRLTINYGKLQDGRYALSMDNPPEKGQNFLVRMTNKFPIIIIFKNNKDIKKLKIIEEPVDTLFYSDKKAKSFIDKMKVFETGDVMYEAFSFDTIILRGIELKSFPKNSNLVVRLDYHKLSDISKTTRELPAEVYFQRKGRIREGVSDKVVGDETGKMIIGVSLILFILPLSIMFLIFYKLKSGTKRDINLEKKLKNILKDGKDWKVHIFKDDIPNAFCIIGPHIFITTGLMKMLTEREIMAVLLHEAGHITNKDMIKIIATKSSLLAILISAAFVLPATVVGFTCFTIFFILNYIGPIDVIFSKTQGRKMETRADSFAVKYGYGDEMGSSLQKIDGWVKKQQSKRPCGPSCQFHNKVSEYIDEHPPIKKRLEDILKDKETWEEKNFKTTKSAREFFMKKFTIKKDN